MINSVLAKRIADMELYILTRQAQGLELGRNARELKELLMREVLAEDISGDPCAMGADGYMAYFERVAERKHGKNREAYLYTMGRIRAFDPEVETKGFEDINKDWLERFGLWCQEQGVRTNTMAIHYRNMRAVFNDAIDNERTTAYPFRRFKIKTAQTAKRSLSVEELRALMSAPLPGSAEEVAVDYFMLIFYLIGINAIDLCHLREVRAGRVEYRRAKTGRLYSLKIEPEAAALIDKYRGEQYLLRILDHRGTHDAWRRYTNKILKGVGSTTQGKRGKLIRRPLYPEITTYWARHTWATIAASLDIPKETIAAALGHGGNSVTDIYIDFDRTKIDAANRRVIDYVLYDKR